MPKPRRSTRLNPIPAPGTTKPRNSNSRSNSRAETPRNQRHPVYKPISKHPVTRKHNPTPAANSGPNTFDTTPPQTYLGPGHSIASKRQSPHDPTFHVPAKLLNGVESAVQSSKKCAEALLEMRDAISAMLADEGDLSLRNKHGGEPKNQGCPLHDAQRIFHKSGARENGSSAEFSCPNGIEVEKSIVNDAQTDESGDNNHSPNAPSIARVSRTRAQAHTAPASQSPQESVLIDAAMDESGDNDHSPNASSIPEVSYTPPQSHTAPLSKTPPESHGQKVMHKSRSSHIATDAVHTADKTRRISTKLTKDVCIATGTSTEKRKSILESFRMDNEVPSSPKMPPGGRRGFSQTAFENFLTPRSRRELCLLPMQGKEMSEEEIVRGYEMMCNYKSVSKLLADREVVESITEGVLQKHPDMDGQILLSAMLLLSHFVRVWCHSILKMREGMGERREEDHEKGN